MNVTEAPKEVYIHKKAKLAIPNWNWEDSVVCFSYPRIYAQEGYVLLKAV